MHIRINANSKKNLQGALIFFACLLSLACGFKPLHAPYVFEGQNSFFKSIHLAPAHLQSGALLVNDKANFHLVQYLRSRMGYEKNTDIQKNQQRPYLLTTSSVLRRTGLGVSSDDIASRYDLTITTKFELTQHATGKSLYKSQVQSVATFGAPRDVYGTAQSQIEASKRVARENADRIIIKLAAYLRKNETKDK